MLLKNYLVSAYRNITRNSFFSIINILGLTIGIVSAILVLLFVGEESAFDRHHTKHDRIFRIISNFHVNDKQDLFAVSSVPIAPTLKEEFAEIEEFVRFANVDNFFFRYNGTEYNEEEFYFTDSTMFKVFDHKFIAGDPLSALSRPGSIVLTETLAMQLFGSDNPIGKVLLGDRNDAFTVTGVIEEVPRTSHFRFRALISINTIIEQVGADRFNDNSSGSFWNVNVYSYLLFKEGTSPETITQNYEPFNEKYIVPVGKIVNGRFAPIFQPLLETHFPKTESLQGDFPVGNRANLYIFSLVSFFILIIACINYMNMATARSASRAREVGIRKVVGAGKSRLIQQFISESMLLAIISGALAFVITAVILPWFNNLADKEIGLIELFNPSFIGGAILIVVFVGLIAGSYPAFFLSSFSPVKVLKGTIDKAKGKVGLRKILVVFQFTISIVMILATIVVSNQQRFIREKDMGFDKKNLLVVSDLDTVISRRIEPIKEELLRNSAIIGVAGSQQVLGINNSKIVSRMEQNGEMQEIAVNLIACDFDYLKVLGVEIDQGRFFDPTLRTDSTQAFIINKTAERVYGWSDAPIGKRIQFGIRMDGSANRDGGVVGVVKDFHYTSIHNPIEPFMFFVSGGAPNVLSIRIKPGETERAIEFIKTKFDEFGATREMKFYFLEERLEELYKSEQKLGWLFRVFSLVTIIISCLGLFGLTSFVTDQRTKEIGVRKVMGSTNFDIIILLSRQFIILVLVANVFALPLGYYAMQKWLQDFSYRIEFGQSLLSISTIGPLLLSSVIALLIAVVTVGILSWRAAESNPAQSLKYE
ncbi:MAG: ABC transporter permease [Tenuifilaceae bacterium]|jgi:putative ABC transport system permease protein|nr:ABC transporter permease [Tenuifilaceae bacterium]